MEAAENILPKKSCKTSEPLALVHTPDIHTIEEVCEFLHSPKEQSCKAVVYQKNADDSYVVLFIRGDLEVNETKLTNYLKEEIHPAVITPESAFMPVILGLTIYR